MRRSRPSLTCLYIDKTLRNKQCWDRLKADSQFIDTLLFLLNY
ncbi:MAG: hypothetical protein OXN25_12795 [Candidatus Poribacteria bacterium]|nr:hypothetical protein [Candidatus Poribacteria bacterium]